MPRFEAPAMNGESLVAAAILALVPSLAAAAPLQTDDANVASPTRRELEELRRRVAELERQRSGQQPAEVNLALDQLPALFAVDEGQALARPWYQNIDLWGFGAFDFLDTGDAGTSPEGGFLVKETTLHIEAHAWENVSFYSEFQMNRLGQDATKFTRTGEVHAHFRDIFGDQGPKVGLKVGRIDIPFGDEYLEQDSIDNPLISNSAPYPYGFDEGVVVYGTWSGVGWITSLTDGTDERSIEDDPAKAFTAKVYGSPLRGIDLSASLLKNGDSAESALEFGGSHLEPVGAGGTSTAGTSPSDKVDALLYELDACCTLGRRARLALALGQGQVDDEVNVFDRDLTWFRIEPRYDLCEKVYLVLRWSEIGTYDSDEGYHFDGKTLAGGNAAFGYDTKSFRRLSAGVGWRPNPHTIVKLEVGQDTFEVIDASPLDPGDQDRQFFGFELVLSF